MPSNDPPGDGWSIGNPDALHPYEVPPEHPAARFISGMEFRATFQVRTPLRILRRQGQVLPLGAELPDDFEPWMGVWVPRAKSFREIGLDVDEPSLDHIVASPAGPVKVVDYLPFLIAVREAVEDTAGGTRGRLERLRAVCAVPEFARYAVAEGGPEAMCNRFFPPILSLLRGLPATSRTALKLLGLSTVGGLRDASDGKLLAVTGLGPSKVKAIREFCAGYGGDPSDERAVNLLL